MFELKNIPTKQLVEELIGRAGVEKMVFEPYEQAAIEVEGPALVLVITD